MKSFNYYFLLFSFVGMNFSHADEGSEEWVWPTYETERVVENKTVILKEKYNYVQSQVVDAAYLKYVSKRKSSYTSPEAAVIARFSAIQTLDFDWWLDSLDDDSKKLAKQKYNSEGLDKKYWQNLWKKQFIGNYIKLNKRIQTGDFVIYTYKIYSKQKKDISGGFEFPLVLKKSNGKWKISLSLRGDPLVVFSPWVSGRNTEVANFSSI